MGRVEVHGCEMAQRGPNTQHGTNPADHGLTFALFSWAPPMAVRGWDKQVFWACPGFVDGYGLGSQALVASCLLS